MHRCYAPTGRIHQAHTIAKLDKSILAEVDQIATTSLRELLVADAVARRTTDLRWAVAAYASIGKRERTSPDTVFRGVIDEVESLTGLRWMPGT